MNGSSAKRSDKVPSLRELHKEVTRQRIFDAARALFAEKGIEQCSVEDILNSAGVSRATFYGYFNGKDGVLLACVERAEKERRGLFRKLLRIPDISFAEIRSWLADHLAAHRAHQDIQQVVRTGFASSPAAKEAVAKSRAAIMADLGQRFPRFSVSESKTGDAPRERFEALMMIVQIEQLCTLLTFDNSLDDAAGLDVIAERLLEFLVDEIAPGDDLHRD